MKSNKTNKWVVSAASAALVASAIVPVASAASFSDIEGNEHKDAILALAEANIVGGYQDGTFKPNAVVTRGNVTKFLGKWLVSEGYEVPTDYATEARFTDLPTTIQDKELLQYAALVKDAGVFKGSNNKLMATNVMSREQMAVVLVRAINTVYGEDLVADYKEAKFESKITDLANATTDENREAIIALEFAGLTKVTAFNPKNTLTRGQFASFLNRTVTTIVEAPLTVKETKVVDATTLEVTLSDDSKHTVTLPTALPENKETTVEFAIDGKDYSAVVTYEVAKLEVKSVSAINTKTIAVTFNNTVKNTTDAKFEIKKGASTLTADVTWNADQTVAYLELAGKITAGTYTVNVKGLSEEALTGSFEAQNEKVAEIKILSDKFVKTGAKTATAGYQVLNQYGEDITKSTLANTVTFTSPQGAINSTTTKGVLAFTATATEIKPDEKVTVVGIDSVSGATATATLTVAAEAIVDTITLGELYNAQGKALSEDTKNLAHYILVDAKDQYGNAVTNATTVDNALTKVNSNSTVATFGAVTTIEINDKDVLAIPVTVVKEGTTTFTAVSNASGKSTAKTVTVAPGVKVDTAVLGQPETGLLGGVEGALIPVELTNTKGEKITKVSDIKNVSLNVSGAGYSANAQFVAKNGEIYVSIDTTSHADTVAKNIVVSITTPTAKTATQLYSVKADAVPTELVGLDSDVNLSVLQGQSIEILESKFIVNDQYGNRITDPSKYDITINLVDPTTLATNGLTPSQDVDVNSKEVVKVTASSTAKADNFVFTLAAQAAGSSVGSDITDAKGNKSQIEKKVSVVADSEFVSYKVATDLGTIYEATTHAKKVTVYGVTATGKEVALPASYFNIIDEKELSASASGTVITVDGTGSSAVANPTVGTAEVDTVDAGFKVVINATGEVFALTGKVTAVAPKATLLSVINTTDNDKVLTTVKDIDNNGIINAADFDDATQQLVAKDQYGVAFTNFTFNTNAATDIKLLFTNLVDAGTKGATIANNGLENAVVNFFGEDDTVNVKITVGTATLDASVAPTVAFAPDFATEVVTLAKQGTNAGETKLTLTGTDANYTYYYKVGSTADARQIEGATFVSTGYTAIAAGTADIAVTANQVITIVAVKTADSKVVSYKTASVTADKIQ